MYQRWSHYPIIWCGDLDGKTLVSAELPLSQISTWPLSCDNVVSRQLMLNKNHDQIHVFLCCLPGESSIKSNITEANVVWLHSFNINAQAAEINAQVLYWISEVGDEINPPLYLFLGVSPETDEILCKTTKQAAGRATPVLTHCENCSESALIS